MAKKEFESVGSVPIPAEWDVFASRKSVIYPVKKEYIKRIFDGSKAYEFRKAFCKEEISSILLYESRGRGMVVGECQITGKICCTPSKMWEQCEDYAGITEKDFFDYFKGCSKACAYVLGDVNIFLEPKPLSYYGIEHVPQNYVYYTKNEKSENE